MKTKKERKIIESLPVCWYGACIDWGNQWGSFDSAIERTQFIIVLAMNLSGLVAVCVLIYGGIQYIMSTGDAERVDRSTNIITNAMIGLVIIIIARLIVTFVIEAIIGA